MAEIMMRTKLILLTNEFPYGSGEPYLEAELPFLAERFKEIIIVPTDAEPTKLRKVPKNVSIHPYFEKKKSTRRSKSLRLHSVALKEFGKEVWGFFKCYGIFPRRSTYVQLFDFLDKGSLIKDFIDALLKEKEYLSSETVIYSYWTAHAAVAAAMLKNDTPGLLVISRAHGWDLYFERIRTRYLPLRPFILKSIDTLYPISGQGAHYLDAKLGFKYQDKIEARYLGVHIHSLEDTKNIKCADVHLVSCSRMVDLKRIHLIIEALSELKSKSLLPTIHWTHLGGGPLFNYLKMGANEGLNGQSHITYEFKGDLTNADVLNFYKTYQVDLFLSTSEWEGLPVAIMEAASFGIPVIATDVGGVSEIVYDGRNGWLVPKELSGVALAKTIERWIHHPELEKHQFRLKSRRIVEGRFCANKNYSDWTDEIINA